MDREFENKLRGRFWITANGHNLAGAGRVDLLKRVGDTGSISAAAKQLKMSYKAAWDSIDAMNKLSENPLVERAAGGKHGGGTVITEAGVRFIDLYDKYAEMFEGVLRFMQDNPEVGMMVDRLSFKSSADNSFFGLVKDIERGAVNAIVSVELDSGIVVTALVTNDSADKMCLAPGTKVCALVNANQLILLSGGDVVTSARNRFSGKVLLIKKGAVNSEITLEMLQGVKLNIMITNESLENMNIAYGMELSAVCKASSIILLV